MTALLSLERLNPRQHLRAGPYAALPGESEIGLVPGERITVRDLMLALLLESANDAAVTLARGAAGSVPAFVRLMNKRAGELHLTHTHYANPVGLDEAGNFSSALDLARLARKLLRNRFFAEVVDLPRARLVSGARPRVVENRNLLVARDPWIDGVKTGHTRQAGYVLVASGRRKGAHLLSVVLGEPSEAARDSESLALLDYGFRLYRRVTAVRKGAEVARADVAFYGDREVSLVCPRSVRVSLRRGQRVRTIVDAPGELDGPLGKRARVGRVRVLVDGRLRASAPLVTAEAVPGASATRKAARYLTRPGSLLAIAAIATLTGAGLCRRHLRKERAARRRAMRRGRRADAARRSES
jgi:serine-type D-Ala-D-Ala carboxypeptidase (penicillin-binding protein 5/6)